MLNISQNKNDIRVSLLELKNSILQHNTLYREYTNINQGWLINCSSCHPPFAQSCFHLSATFPFTSIQHGSTGFTWSSCLWSPPPDLLGEPSTEQGHVAEPTITDFYTSGRGIKTALAIELCRSSVMTSVSTHTLDVVLRLYCFYGKFWILSFSYHTRLRWFIFSGIIHEVLPS